MKRIMLVLLLVRLVGCRFDQELESKREANRYITFEEVSQPYLDQYGDPEEIDAFYSVDWWTIDWWYWNQGLMVAFLNSNYDDTNGWTVNHIYNFSPF